MSDAGGQGDELAAAAAIVRDLGFSIVTEVDPSNPAATDLVVALRDAPTLRHFDPETVEYWATHGERSVARTIARGSAPAEGGFEWGRISIADRLGMSNQWLSFGGELRSVAVDATTTVVRFRSPAPIQRWSGHSQGLDLLTPEMGAFFGRLMVPVDFQAGAEGRLVRADPLALYCAFLADAERRTGASGASGAFGVADRPLVTKVRNEAHRLRGSAGDAWRAGEALLGELGLAS